jgi:hypothetical protein
MTRRFVDDALTVSVGALRLRPRERRDEEVLVLEEGPVTAAIGYRWTTDRESGTVVLRYGRASGTFQVVSWTTAFGTTSWYFVCPATGERVLKVYCVDGRWGTKGSLGLAYRCLHFGTRKRLEHARTKVTKELMRYTSRRPRRIDVLEERLASLNAQLEHA